jgi:transcriptional regulator with XRE-family HTH domain
VSLPDVDEKDLQRTLGRNLQSLRKARGLSQEAFAEMLGVHRTYLGGIERGERNLTLKSLERIAGRIEVDPLALLGEGGGNRPLRHSIHGHPEGF